MTTVDVQLERQRRGTEFRYSSSLATGWTAGMFNGGIKFTVRKRIPPSSVVGDYDPDVVAQVSVADGGIVFSSDTDFTVTIPGRITTRWPLATLYWDMQGVINASPENRVLDIAAGTVDVDGDVTRS